MSDPEQTKKILIIKLGALGDIISSLHTMFAIRKHFPNASIDLLTRHQFVSFCQFIPWYDKVITAENHKPWQIIKWWKFSQLLRAQKYDFVIDLQCKPRTTFYQLLFGFRSPKWAGSSPFSTYKRPKRTHPNQPQYALQEMQMESAHIPWVGLADLDWLAEPVANFNPPSHFVILVPGCSVQHPYKRWPASSFAKLAEELRKKGIESIIIGTNAEKDVIEELATLAPNAINLINQTSIKQLSTLSRSALAVISNDTGPAHITAAIGAPTLVLMSYISIPERMLPQGKNVSFIKKDNIADITVEEVCASLKLLNNI